MIKQSLLNFFSGEQSLNFRMGIIMGTCRTGKTLLGNILATAREVEFAEEPWLPYQLPVLAGNFVIARNIALNMFRAYAAELINEMVLLRSANFRSGDICNVWNQKTAADIQNRLSQLNSRADVQAFIKTNHTLILFALAETHAFCDFFTEAIPECKLIYVIRKGEDVALDIVAKQWFSSEQLLKPANALLLKKFSYKSQEWYLPWWVEPNDEEEFINFSDLERAFYYWCNQTERGLKAIKQLQDEKMCLIVRFEDLVNNPQECVGEAADFLGVTLNLMSAQIIEKVYPRYQKASFNLNKINKRLHDRIKTSYTKFNYHLETSITSGQK